MKFERERDYSDLTDQDIQDRLNRPKDVGEFATGIRAALWQLNKRVSTLEQKAREPLNDQD
ncbi:MAG: hypothetical protein VB099_16500 [Candidatus Limiplasma sp.]|nr:hypothetical protein [Candidatus Limiplasma sp.]